MHLEHLNLGLLLAALGMTVVFISLWLVATVIGVLNRIGGKDMEPAAAEVQPMVTPPLAEGIDGRTLAIIAAAATVAVAKPVQVLRVQPSGK